LSLRSPRAAKPHHHAIEQMHSSCLALPRKYLAKHYSGLALRTSGGGSDVQANARRGGLVVGEVRQGHEAHALIRILLEYRNLARAAAAVGLARNQLAEIGDAAPARDAFAHRFEKIGLLVHDRLLFQGGDDAVGPSDHFVIELAARTRHRALKQDAFVAGDDRGDVLTLVEPGAEEHRNIGPGRAADEIGAARDVFGFVHRLDTGTNVGLHLIDETPAVLVAAAVDLHGFDAWTNGAHGNQMPAGLPAGAIKAQDAAIVTCQRI